MPNIESLTIRGQIPPEPGPGIYEGVPFDDYLAWPYVSNSALHPAARSMAHFRDRQPIDETAAMRFGTLCHTGRLEPSAIFRRYVVMPDLTKGITTKDGKPAKSPKATEEYDRRVAEFMSQHDGMKVVEQATFDEMLGVLQALDNDPLARRWFGGPGQFELSIVWDDPESGLRCKGRLDKICNEERIIPDLKTTVDCTKFDKSIANYSYYRQAALYIDGWQILTGETYRFGLVAVEKVKPFGVMSAPMRADAIELGRKEYRGLLKQIAASKRSGSWPGYESPAEWSLPAWKLRGGDDDNEVALTIGGKQFAL